MWDKVYFAFKVKFFSNLLLTFYFLAKPLLYGFNKRLEGKRPCCNKSLEYTFKLKQWLFIKIDLEYVAYYEKPLLKFERILETFVATWPFSLKPFIKAIQEWLGEKIKVEQKIRKKLDFKGKIYFVPHHLSHAAAAFYPSPFKKSAILTVDGVGEYQTIGIWKGMGNKIKPIKEINFPHSLGLLYSTFTAFLGFRVNDDEYKVMGMAAYGKPSFKNSIYELIDIKDDGSLQLDLSYFGYRESFQM